MNQKPEAGADGEGQELTGRGMGEAVDFLSQDNHIFINKLNYICKNYDTSFKDVSHTQASFWPTIRALLRLRLTHALLRLIGETHENDDGGHGADPAGEAAPRRQRDLRQGRLPAIKAVDDREPPADHDSGDS